MSPRIGLRHTPTTQAKIISVDNDHVVVEISNTESTLKIGERVMATAPSLRKTALGKHTQLSDVVISGKVANIEGKKVTVISKSSQPIIVSDSLKNAYREKTPVRIKKISTTR